MHKDVEACNLYSERLGIETLFKALKNKGFDLEKTRMTDYEKLSKLMSIVALGTVIAVKIGVFRSESKP